jgi:hypothetical protein
MRVILEAIAGPSGAKRIVLATGQVVKIGRTEAADMAFPRDGHMSGIHFQVQTTRDACIVTDLGSTNHTFVNQAQVTKPTVLRGGEQISAGQTVFTVRIEADVKASIDFMPAALYSAGQSLDSSTPQPGDGPSSTPPLLALPSDRPAPELLFQDPPSVDWLPSPSADPSPRPRKTPVLAETPAYFPGEIVLPSQLEPQGSPHLDSQEVPPLGGQGFSPLGMQELLLPSERLFTSESCDSGLTLCRGDISALPAAEVALRLSRIHPFMLVVDFNRLGSPRPAELTLPQYIFNWLDPLAAESVSPLVIGQGELPTWPAIVEEGWGKDAVICLFSKRGQSAVLEHVRQCCRGKGHGTIIGYCWPSVLAPVLSHSKDMAGHFMEAIDAVLVELPDLPETWQIYGGEQIIRDLEELGLARERPRPTTTRE